MKKLKQNLDFMYNHCTACNETATPDSGIAFVANEPLYFNGHSLDVDVCMKTGNNLSPVNLNVIPPSSDVASSVVESIVNSVDNKEI